jgi:hypothetical protein
MAPSNLELAGRDGVIPTSLFQQAVEALNDEESK